MMTSQPEVEQKQIEFEQVALVYIDSLYNAALRMTGNQPDAEDLVQETYLKAYRFFHRFRKDSNCLAWLFKIMKNSYINRFRQKVREPVMVDYDTAKPAYDLARLEAGDTSGSPEEEVLSKLLDDEVERAIRALPDEFKLVVILSDIEGFQYKEIAEILGCPIGTVRSRLSRGRRLLRKQLWDYAKDLGYIKKDDSYGL